MRFNYKLAVIEITFFDTISLIAQQIDFNQWNGIFYLTIFTINIKFHVFSVINNIFVEWNYTVNN